MRIIKAILALPFAVLMLPMLFVFKILDWLGEEIEEWIDMWIER